MNKTLCLYLFITAFITTSAQSLIGEKAPDIVVKEWINHRESSIPLSKQISNKELKGKVIVLDFWFTQCAPCVASIPHLNGLAKKFPEVVFLSINFDKKAKVEKFMNNQLLFYPIGIDEQKQTISNYKVHLYPETFVIDTNGRIVFQGTSLGLDTKTFEKIIGLETSQSISVSSADTKTKKKNFTFKVEKNKHDMENSSYSQSWDYKTVIFNQSLQDILSTFYEISHSRIISSDTAFLNTKFDATLELEEKFFNKGENKELIKFLLSDHLNYQIEPITVEKKVWQMKITDSLKLEQFKFEKNYSSSSSGNHWHVFEGYTLSLISHYFEDEYDVLITPVKLSSDPTYKLKLPNTESFEEFRSYLKKEIGIMLIQKKEDVTLFKIIVSDNGN